MRWSEFSGDPRRKDVVAVRATDADRELALVTLREAFADGRLDREEYDRRSSAALSVRVLGQLFPLLGDLEAPLPVARGVHDRAVARYRRDLTDSRNGLVFVGGITTVIWAVSSVASREVLFFWPAIPIAAIGLGWAMQKMNRERRIAEHERRIERRIVRRRRDADD